MLNVTFRRQPEIVNGVWTPWGKFAQHRRDARSRGIPFLLSPDEWWRVWKSSGKWCKRGTKDGQYVMARYGDVGPYAIGNVKIIKANENHSEANLGRSFGPMSIEHRAAVGDALRGRRLSQEHRQKISAGVKGKTKGRKKSPGQRTKQSAAMKGRKRGPFTKQTRRNLSIAITKYWNAEQGLARRGFI